MFGLAALALAAALAGCSDPAATATGSRDGSQPQGPEMQDGKYVVHLSSSAFAPADLAVPAGATVLWKVDQGMHDVTEGAPGSEPAWSSDDEGGRKLYAGQTYERTFSEAGTVSYRCVIHEQAGMLGTITVG